MAPFPVDILPRPGCPDALSGILAGALAAWLMVALGVVAAALL